MSGWNKPTRSGSEPMSAHLIDFQGVAGLIDAVAGADPARLSTLLRVLLTSEERLEARVVVELALRCRDPLAPHATLCHDALQAASDFDHLLRSEPWQDVRHLLPNARAKALLNLCDETLTDANPLKSRRRERCREIRPRLETAAITEQNARAEAREQIEAARAAHCPSYWPLLRTFLSQTLSTPA